MINKHLIKDNKLILFIDYNYEIGSFNNKKITFSQSIKDYIKKHNIKFSGEILLVVGTIILATFNFNNNDLTLKAQDISSDAITYTTPFQKINNIPEIKPSIKESKIKEIEKSTTTNTQKNSSKSTTKTTTNKKEANSNKKTTKKTKKQTTSTNKNTSNKSNSKTSSNNTVKKNTSQTASTNKNESSTKVTVYRSNGNVITLDLEEYLIGVVAGEMPASFEIEALKAQAILARTYALKSIKINKKLTDTTSTQVYIDDSQMKNKWGKDYTKYYNRVKQAVDKTKGIYVTYNGELIDAVYHSMSNGKTEDSINVWGHNIPYLKSVDSSYDKTVTGYLKTITKTETEILNIFGIENLTDIEILSRNSSGRVSSIRVGDNTYTGVDVRTLLGLRSADFDIELKDGNIVITTRGFGHGVGMSQYGANGMAKKGNNYEQIIKHYYTGVKINK